jgi:hypothetical protein
MLQAGQVIKSVRQQENYYRKKILQEGQFWLSFLIYGRNGEIKLWLEN